MAWAVSDQGPIQPGVSLRRCSRILTVALVRGLISPPVMAHPFRASSLAFSLAPHGVRTIHAWVKRYSASGVRRGLHPGYAVSAVLVPKGGTRGSPSSSAPAAAGAGISTHHLFKFLPRELICRHSGFDGSCWTAPSIAGRQ